MEAFSKEDYNSIVRYFAVVGLCLVLLGFAACGIHSLQAEGKVDIEATETEIANKPQEEE
jgi:hypothetical protein